ncbi:MAG: hypothetical protein K5892_07475 [Acholeplasmatales bacterium]|nr:hypothetical protein [Acholeplasmatales bacterium]
MELRDYLNKYFRFNRKTERQFVYTFFPTFFYKINNLNKNKFRKILNDFSDKYYEYSFDKDRIKEFKRMSFNEDKCIITLDYKSGLFYDSYNNEISVFGELKHNIPIKPDELGLISSRGDDEVKRFYEPLIKNPSLEFKRLLNTFIYYVNRDTAYEPVPSVINKDESEVIINIILDLSSYNNFLFNKVLDYYNDDRLTNYLLLIYECPNVDDRVKEKAYFKLLLKTNKLYDVDKINNYLRKDYFFNGLEYLSKYDDSLFNGFAKEALKADSFMTRRESFDIILRRYKYDINYKIKADIFKYILSYKCYNSDKYNRYLDELLDGSIIDDFKCLKLLDKYKTEPIEEKDELKRIFHECLD